MLIVELKRILIGSPLTTEHQSHERLNKRTALAVFSSDAISSVAYATESILNVLLIGAAAAGLSLPIATGIAVLLLTVAFSYRQTIHAYPSGGGGAYIVAHENLGRLPGLVAAAALLIDYVLTVAVSISAGVAAITSLSVTWVFPTLHTWAVPIAIVCIVIVTLVNLRGVRESPYRSLLQPILSYLDDVGRDGEDTMTTVVLPEFVPAHWWEYFMHNQSALLIKLALMYGRGMVVTSVPSHLSE